jgi:hypothetical protein
MALSLSFVACESSDNDEQQELSDSATPIEQQELSDSATPIEERELSDSATPIEERELSPTAEDIKTTMTVLLQSDGAVTEHNVVQLKDMIFKRPFTFLNALCEFEGSERNTIISLLSSYVLSGEPVEIDMFKEWLDEIASQTQSEKQLTVLDELREQFMKNE